MSLLHADLDDSVYFDELPQRVEVAAALTDPRARRTRTLFGPAEANEVLREMTAPWIQDLGLTVEACSPAGAALRLPRNARLLSLGNTLSGPALMACADTAMAIAIQGHFGELRNVATVTMVVDFMLPIAAGDVTIAATVRRRRRSLVYPECTFIEPRSRDIAVHATATWAVMPWPLAARG